MIVTMVQKRFLLSSFAAQISSIFYIITAMQVDNIDFLSIKNFFLMAMLMNKGYENITRICLFVVDILRVRGLRRPPSDSFLYIYNTQRLLA